MRRVVIKNKINGSEMDFEDVTSIIEDDETFRVIFPNETHLMFQKSHLRVETYTDEPVGKLIEKIKQLEKENEELRNTIITMCKSVWGDTV